MDKLNQQAPTHQAPRIQKKAHGSKTMLFIFGAVILLVVLGIYVLGTKKSQTSVFQKVPSYPIPTSTCNFDREMNDSVAITNWKTYKNKDLAFFMQYPSTWTYRETTEGYVNLNGPGYKSTFIFLGNPFKARINGKEENVTTETVSLFITPKTQDYNIEQILKKRYFGADFLKAQNRYGENISVGGINAKQIINTKCIRDDCITVLLEKDNLIFDFRLKKSTIDPTFQCDKYLQKETFYQILSTFQFSP